MSGPTLKRVNDLCGSNGRRSIGKEMHMIRPPIECTYCPGVRLADTADFLFDQGSQLANQNLFAVCGTPDKVIG
jgi:hypothetical protein